MSLSLHTLPIDIVYRIFDHLSEKYLFLSTNNLNQRFNAILNSYKRFQVNSTNSHTSTSINSLTWFSTQTLTTLNLRWNKIGVTGTQAIGQALQRNQVKYVLNFFTCTISLPYLLQTLTALHLGYNEIGSVGLQAIGQALERNQVRYTFNFPASITSLLC